MNVNENIQENNAEQASGDNNDTGLSEHESELSVVEVIHCTNKTGTTTDTETCNEGEFCVSNPGNDPPNWKKRLDNHEVLC